MDDLKEKNQNDRKGSGILSLAMNLAPAVVVAALITVSLPGTAPVLQEIPDRLTMKALAETMAPSEAAPESSEAAESVQGQFTDGVYRGIGTGYGGKITAEVTVKEGNITSVEIVSAPGETDSFFRRAKAVIDSVLARQTWEVDVVSGATYSSKGILAAIENALTGEEVEQETAPVQESLPLAKEEFQDPAAYKDGSYSGTARGFGGMITAKVTIRKGKITDITITGAPGETPSYLSKARAVIAKILAGQSPNVDTISGATYSSNGIINAVKNALKLAAGETVEDTEAEESQETETEKTVIRETEESDDSSSGEQNSSVPGGYPKYKDGTYTGRAEGFGGDVVVTVTVSGGKISNVAVVSAEDETPSFFERALVLTGLVVEKQTTDLDVISGATYSSRGILDAAADALKDAVVETDENAGGSQDQDASAPENNNHEESSAVGGNQETTGPENNDHEESSAVGGSQGTTGPENNNHEESSAVGENQESSAPENNNHEESSDIGGNQETTASEHNNQEESSAAGGSRETQSDSQNTESGGEESSSAETGEELSPAAKYKDGVYTGVELCEDTEDGEFYYYIKAVVTVKNGQIQSIALERQQDSDDNSYYVNRAARGTSSIPGVISQILEKQDTEGIDAVSRATYSSNAIQKAVKKALVSAEAGRSSLVSGENKNAALNQSFSENRNAALNPFFSVNRFFNANSFFDTNTLFSAEEANCSEDSEMARKAGPLPISDIAFLTEIRNAQEMLSEKKHGKEKPINSITLDLTI